MAFTIEDAGRSWPWLYHHTDARNLDRIRRQHRLDSLKELLVAAGPSSAETHGRKRRAQAVTISIDGDSVFVRDQKPMALGAIVFDEGFGERDLIELINRRVFFWPGRADGPIKAGRGLRAAYRDQATLRVPFADLVVLNDEPTFCRFNSGAARSHPTATIRRGPWLFALATAADFRPSQIKEITFEGHVRLPPTTEFRAASAGPWARLRP